MVTLQHITYGLYGLLLVIALLALNRAKAKSAAGDYRAFNRAMTIAVTAIMGMFGLAIILHL